MLQNSFSMYLTEVDQLHQSLHEKSDGHISCHENNGHFFGGGDRRLFIKRSSLVFEKIRLC